MGVRTRLGSALPVLLLAVTCSTPSDPARQPAASVPPPLAAPPTAMQGAVVKAATSTTRPGVQPGFGIDLVAEAPEILWPSAILCLDDGSLHVGEDRMDMPGPTDQPVDRVIGCAGTPTGRSRSRRSP